MTSGYQALRESAAWYDVSARGKIYARGEDRKRLLHAMTTNHIENLEPGQGLYAFFLTAQGRIIADADIFALEDALLLDTEPGMGRKLYEHLDKYIIADDVALEDATEALATLEVSGPAAEEMLKRLHAPLPQVDHSFTRWDTEIVARVTSTGAPGVRILTPATEKEELILALEEGGIVRADEESWDTVRLENGTPRYGVDVRDTNLPQETQVMRALHFQKGCYIGQEIVERVRSRGHVNRLLVPLAIDATTAPAPAEKVMSDGKEVGEITSARYSPALQQVVALAYVRAEAMQSALQCGGTAVSLRSHQA